MPIMSNLGAVMRPDLNVFYVLDTSGSMRGKGIGVLNRAMDETVDALREVTAHHGDANVKIAVLEFNSRCRWINPDGPEYLKDFLWRDLGAAGETRVGDALRELDAKLSRNAFLNSMTSAYLPVIIFMTDGDATDEYEPALRHILRNRWFAKATRVGFAIGSDPNVEMIAKLVGNSEAVIRTEDLNVFAQLLRFVSVSASTLAGSSHTRDQEVSGEEAVRMGRIMAGVTPREVSAGINYREPRSTNYDWSGPVSWSDEVPGLTFQNNPDDL